MKNNPLVSVVMPVYNAEKFLKTSIESILNQTYKNFEFIIVDDASTDYSRSLLQKYKKKDKRIILSKNSRNTGVAKSLNKGLKGVQGKYVIRMDADDYSYPNRFESQVMIMEKNPNIVVSGSFIEVCDSDLKMKHIRKYQLDDKNIRSRLFRYSPFAHPATIWRADLLKREKYNDRVKNCEDYELYFRIGKLGDFMNVSKVLLKLRLHQLSVSASMNDSQSKATISVRYNAVKNLGYRMTYFDRVYNILQSLCIGLIPVKLRFFLFNKLRTLDFY